MIKLKVLTLNTWNHQGPWQERWRLILSELKKYEPGILLFQEVTQKEWIQNELQKSGYPFFAFANDGSGLLSASRWPMEDTGHIRYKCQSPTEANTRTFLYFRIALGLDKFLFVNTHLSWKPEESSIREEQTLELKQWISRQREKWDENVVLTGDLNACPETEEILHLTRKGMLRDAFKHMNPDVPGLSWDNRNSYTATHGLPDRRLDYILFAGQKLSEKLRCSELVMTQPSKEGVFPSDHFGVLAEWEIE